MTQGGSGEVQEVQLTAPRSTKGVTDNQHEERARKKWGGGGESEIQKRGGDEGEMHVRRGREREKVFITQMDHYAPSIHPMLPYLLAHATGVLIGQYTVFAQALCKFGEGLCRGMR